jgi:hypothetical protein
MGGFLLGEVQCQPAVRQRFNWFNEFNVINRVKNIYLIGIYFC